MTVCHRADCLFSCSWLCIASGNTILYQGELWAGSSMRHAGNIIKTKQSLSMMRKHGKPCFRFVISGGSRCPAEKSLYGLYSGTSVIYCK